MTPYHFCSTLLSVPLPFLLPCSAPPRLCVPLSTFHQACCPPAWQHNTCTHSQRYLYQHHTQPVGFFSGMVSVLWPLDCWLWYDGMECLDQNVWQDSFTRPAHGSQTGWSLMGYDVFITFFQQMWTDSYDRMVFLVLGIKNGVVSFVQGRYDTMECFGSIWSLTWLTLYFFTVAQIAQVTQPVQLKHNLGNLGSNKESLSYLLFYPKRSTDLPLCLNSTTTVHSRSTCHDLLMFSKPRDNISDHLDKENKTIWPSPSKRSWASRS